MASSSPLLISPSIAEDLARVEAELRDSVKTDNAFLTEVASHLILAGGKRIRPGFTIASAFGAVADARPADHAVLMGAVSVELVHLGSLYHDDVMDDAATRRTVDSVNDEGLRQPCTDSNECAGVYACREGTCCPPWLTDCAPVDTTCGLNHEARSEDGVPVTLCADGVDNDRDGLTDLLDEGCLGDPTQDTEADCKKGGFYTTHVAKKDGSPGGPDFEGALLDMLEHLDANYRTKAPETVTVKR